MEWIVFSSNLQIKKKTKVQCDENMQKTKTIKKDIWCIRCVGVSDAQTERHACRERSRRMSRHPSRYTWYYNHVCSHVYLIQSHPLKPQMSHEAENFIRRLDGERKTLIIQIIVLWQQTCTYIKNHPVTQRVRYCSYLYWINDWIVCGVVK